jgi:transcription initiation factor TFIID TATA-box-binding protein
VSETSPCDVKIQNVVAVANLGQKMDLLAIMKVFSNVEYRPKKFPGLVFKLKRPRTSTLIFSTGKMVCPGAKSEKEAFSVVRRVVRELRKEGFIISMSPKIDVVNVVGTADVRGEIDLEAMSDVLENVMYEPEQFPGLIYRMTDPKVVLLVFASGKLVIVGAKRREQVYEAADKIRAILIDHELLH